ncbi:MAG: 4Fe-4S binding protein [Proteobacteria bacterium]|nr:4Fe-4S binding protein [Pseudomonadota bacterium]
MYSKILVLRFPVKETTQPLVCLLAKKFDLNFSILKATVLPRKEGIMVLELSGSRKKFNAGVDFLKSQGVDIKTAASEISRNDSRCIHCGACTAVCPTTALSISRPEMIVEFNLEKCSVCELCVSSCPTRAMRVKPTSEAFFFE